MNTYKCDYCGDSLCPETCSQARQAVKEFVESEEYKNREELDFIL